MAAPARTQTLAYTLHSLESCGSLTFLTKQEMLDGEQKGVENGMKTLPSYRFFSF